jgi:hypothetical protein
MLEIIISISVIVDKSLGSHPSSPRPSHPPPWASDGQEPPPYGQSVSKITTEKEMLPILKAFDFFGGTPYFNKK